jgi:hypothetical protein
LAGVDGWTRCTRLARMSTRRIVSGALVIAGACLGLAAAYADGPWQDLWLNLLAEAVGAAFIVLFVDVLFERSKAREHDARRRTALHELGSILRELQAWLAGFIASDPAVGRRKHAGGTDVLAGNLDGLVASLGTIDFAAPGALKRDRYFVEWGRRTFDQTTIELGRWEFNFVDSAGLFGDDFREGAESLRTFVRAMAAFLEGMERYVTRESPTSPVRAYEGVTELTAETAARLVSDLQEFLRFYHELCDRYGVVSPGFATSQ